VVMSLKDAMLQDGHVKGTLAERLQVQSVNAQDLEFKPIDVPIPPIPMLSYGLDRVLFNPGVYRLQDPRSRVYNFDPYLEKIMKVNEFDFSALEEYKTSSQDPDLLAITERLGTKFTGSTSSMSGILQHFHYLLSSHRGLNHDMLSRAFPKPSDKFSKITQAPNAVFLRWKNGVYAIDADKAYDTPNIMSWLGNSLEKLLTVEKDDFERYRKSNPEKAPEELGGRCFHYSSQGNFLMRSQLDAVDPRLPGSGVFDLKTRAVVSIRMDHQQYEKGSGYQLRYDHGQWESFEREFYDMTRATMLKYSLQVRMGRMDGIFVAYHNIERIFGFQYLSLPDLDLVLHGQSDTCLGDQEFKFSIHLLDEALQKAIEKFPEQTLRLHFLTKSGKSEFMYIFAEPVTDAQADEIQATNKALTEQFEREVVGIGRPGSDEQGLQAEWQNIQHRVDEEVKDDNSESIEEAEENEEESEDSEELDEETDTTVEDVKSQKQALGAMTTWATSNGPLAGWTLAIRNRINGKYVSRPEGLAPNDNWSVEYHLNELPEHSVWSLYNKVKDERSKSIGEQRESDEVGLQFYRKMIHKYSAAGRAWRDQQDEIENETGQTVYEPFGPGS
ncbi:Pet127-domain-containing protein, partial [Periconia macrospinosa]